MTLNVPIFKINVGMIDQKGVNVLTGGLAKRVQYNKGDCIITNHTASRRKYTAKYFYSRAKALNPATLPVYQDPTLHDDGLCRTREWNSYTFRVLQISLSPSIIRSYLIICVCPNHRWRFGIQSMTNRNQELTTQLRRILLSMSARKGNTTLGNLSSKKS
jgi:hypothetical protein